MQTQRIGPSLALAGLLLGACSPQPQANIAKSQEALNAGDELALLGQREAPDTSRQAADQALVARHGRRYEPRLVLLEQTLYAPGHAPAMRRYALEALVAADPGRGAQAIGLYLPRMEDWPLLAAACQAAGRLKDPRLIEPLVRSWARPATSYARLDRPERQALEAITGRLWPEALEQVLTRGRFQSARLAALEVLREQQGDKAAEAKLAQTQQPDPLVRQLLSTLEAFDYLPSGPLEMSWLQRWQRPENQELWEQARRAHRRLARESDYQFAPRFLYLLTHLSESELSRSRSELLEAIGGDLRSRRHIARQPRYSGAPDDQSETLEAQAKKLSRCDLLLLKVLLDRIGEAAFQRELLRWGQEDLSDTTCEHGGLFYLEQNALAGRLFPSLLTGDDEAYVASDRLLSETAMALGQFHFHCQRPDNRENAGPGAGDLTYAQTMRLNALVLTSIGPERLDIDFYTPAGAVIDLGIFGP